MKRLIIVPQYPTKLRYQEWWYTQFPEQFGKVFDEVIVLGTGSDLLTSERQQSHFAPIEQAIHFELQQIAQFNKMKLHSDDTLLLNDISFPGLFASVLFHKRPNKCFAICHATSINNYDIFAPVQEMKWPVESATAKLFDGVLVGSYYHARKLLGWNNCFVNYLPFTPVYGTFEEKCYTISTVARKCPQKRDEYLENLVCGTFKTKIHEPPSTIDSWEEYFLFLAKTKILLITSKEETFGYQIIDALLNKCIVIAPNDFSYPELLPSEYLYSTEQELLEKVGLAIQGSLPSPGFQKNVFDSSVSFYMNVAKLMKK